MANGKDETTIAHSFLLMDTGSMRIADTRITTSVRYQFIRIELTQCFSISNAIRTGLAGVISANIPLIGFGNLGYLGIGKFVISNEFDEKITENIFFLAFFSENFTGVR